MDGLIPLVRQVAFALVATFGFAVLFNVPRRTLVPCVAFGGIAYFVKQLMLLQGTTNELATLVAALTLGLLGELAARFQRAPAVVFFMTGFVSLVPGVLSYRTVLLFIEGDYNEGIVSAVRTILIAGAIAGGLGAVTALFRLRRNN